MGPGAVTAGDFHDEQVVERFKRWFSPFDQNIYELTKLKSSDILEIYTWLVKEIQNQLDSLDSFESYCIKKEQMHSQFDGKLIENLWKYFVSERSTKSFRFVSNQ